MIASENKKVFIDWTQCLISGIFTANNCRCNLKVLKLQNLQESATSEALPVLWPQIAHWSDIKGIRVALSQNQQKLNLIVSNTGIIVFQHALCDPQFKDMRKLKRHMQRTFSYENA